MKKTVEKKATLSFKKGLEVMKTGFFDLEDEAEISLDKEFMDFFEIGDIVKFTATKIEDVTEE